MNGIINGGGRDFLCRRWDFLLEPTGMTVSGVELFRRVGFTVGRLAIYGRRWGFLWKELPT
jgi:hypothetical protein